MDLIKYDVEGHWELEELQVRWELKCKVLP